MIGAISSRQALALVLALFALIRPVCADTLPEVLGKALARHPGVRSGEALRSASDEQLNQVRSNYYPILGIDMISQDASDQDFGISRDRSTRRADAFLRWNLFRGLGDREGERTAEFNSLAARADLDAAGEQAALQITLAYLDVLRLRSILALDNDFQVELKRLDGDMAKRFQVGRIPQVDKEQSRASLIQASARQAQLQGQLRGAEIRFRLLVGYAPGVLSEVTLDDAAAQLDQDALLEGLLAGNDRLRGSRQRSAARGAEVGVAESAFYPRLELEVRRRLHNDVDPVPQTQTQDMTQFQLNYQIPLGGSTFSRKREAIARRQAAEAALDEETLRAQSEITQLWSAWREARNIAPQLAERAIASVSVVKAYDLQFEAGRRSLNELIGARNEQYRVRVDALENRMEQISTNARVLALLGRLRASLLGDRSPRPAPHPVSTHVRPEKR